MSEEKRDLSNSHEPSGLTPRTSGLASEYAREQGWDLNEEQRVKTSTEKQNYDGGTDYEYGARDFGDTAVDTSSAKPGVVDVHQQGTKKPTGVNTGPQTNDL